MYSPNASKGFISLVGNLIVQMPHEVSQNSLPWEKSREWFKEAFEELRGAFTSITTANHTAQQALDSCLTGEQLLEGIDHFSREGDPKAFWAHNRSLLSKRKAFSKGNLKGYLSRRFMNLNGSRTKGNS